MFLHEISDSTTYVHLFLKTDKEHLHYEWPHSNRSYVRTYIVYCLFSKKCSYYTEYTVVTVTNIERYLYVMKSEQRSEMLKISSVSDMLSIFPAWDLDEGFEITKFAQSSLYEPWTAVKRRTKNVYKIVTTKNTCKILSSISLSI